MKVTFTLNGRKYTETIEPAQPLIDFLREKGCYSVKRGCETAGCGLCTVLLDGTPVLSCSMPAARIDGHNVKTLEGVREKAEAIGMSLAAQGAEQCGFCSPGLIMNIIAMENELQNPTDDEIRAYLAGNLCRCTGYVGQLRGIHDYFAAKENAQ